MIIFKYPPDIQKLLDTFEPYRKEILSKDFEHVPPEAVDAYNEFKKWAREEGQ